MDSRNTPYRSEVSRWSPEDLADYFRRLNFKDCEKVVKKHGITGQRFLNMSDNDLQKFPKLSVPILSKLSQEINRHEEKRSFFPKRTQIQKAPENTEYRQDEGDGWSSFEESDDYESPDEEEPEGSVDYETPNDQDGAEDENEADYEPPPSNDNETVRNIFPNQRTTITSEYIDRSTTERSKVPLQPPPPPERPGPSPVPPPSKNRNPGQPNFLPPTSNNESREKSTKSFKTLGPSVDRSKKPPLDQPGPPFDRNMMGTRTFPEMSSAPQFRSLGKELAKLQKPPVPSIDGYDRNNPTVRRKLPPINNNQLSEKNAEMEDSGVPQRPPQQPPLQLFNTFPSRSKPHSKQVPLPPKGLSEAYPESTVSSTGSLPSHLPPRNISRNFSKGPADGRPPLPIPTRPSPQFPRAENEDMEQCSKLVSNQDVQKQKWYAADTTRTDAEVALRRINQDGTFLVRNSSKKALEQPYTLMVLYHNKVYNIQIRYQKEDKTYFLGTYLKGNEVFSSVTDIIDFFRRMPLLLIDGKDQCSKKQCTLTYAAEVF
ncbi:lymphocyte cytosolic protein 2 isoform X1 [Varanus komodoensis]|uniref:lymphocyte cytosolic protein 2 isoform X1 n=1 Tax=Varanus komodoensis TaxID=61221 RepID=UPI001CF7C72A|nr:lymphocyte cytosolic protein 2 isoform X1 [Varanus komodoensis]XP_044309813.1 lymphocyte cytosolic protein 2 isoform X1 [Varanus komodoensis]